MKNFRSSASSSLKPSNIVVALGEKPAQKPNSLSPRLSRKGLSSVCVQTGTQTVKAKTIARISFEKGVIGSPSIIGLFQQHLFSILVRVLNVVLPKYFQTCDF